MKILKVIHSFVPYTQAGTEIYAYSLAKALAQDNDVSVFFRINNRKIKEYSVSKGKYENINIYAINFTLRNCRSFRDTYSNKAIDEAFSRVLDEVKPDIIHIHHLLFLSLGMVNEARTRKIPIVFTLHDYWLFCHRGQLINDKLSPCSGYEDSRCSSCLKMQIAIRPKAIYFYQLFRRILPFSLLRVIKNLYFAATSKQAELNATKERYNYARAIISYIDIFLSPSNFMREKAISFGVPPEKVIYLRLGIDHSLFHETAKNKSKNIRFGYIGIILPMKGLDVLLEAFHKLPGSNLELLIFGKLFPYAGYESYSKALERYARIDGRIKIMGAFEHENINNIFAQIDVLVVPSIWPENSPLVIQEAFLAKIPVIASKIGGIPELIEDNKNGLCFKPGDVQDLHKKLLTLINNPDLLNRLKNIITEVKDISENAQELEKIYSRLKQDQFPIKTVLGRDFFLEPPVLIPNVVLVVRGKVTNTGSLSWDNFSEKQGGYFRLGFRIYGESEPETVICEGRYFFDERTIRPGEFLEFSLSVNIPGFNKGRYVLAVNILKENSFWFDDKGMPSEKVNFEVSSQAKIPLWHKIGLKIPGLRGTRILLVLPNIPQYDKSSGERRLLEIIKVCKQHGLRINIFADKPLDCPNAGKYHKILKPLIEGYFEGPYAFWKSFKPGAFDYGIISWYGLGEKYLDVLRLSMPEAKLIVDSVDVHWKRYERGIKSGELLIKPDELDSAKAKEKQIYAKADEIWAVTAEDKDEILKELPKTTVRVVSNIHYKDPHYLHNPAANNNIIFVGGFNHPPNESAALWGYDICRQFRNKTPYNPGYYIIGDNPPPAACKLHDGKNTIVTGFVEDLNEYYKHARIMLAPIKYGSGIKGKICHAICSGVPVITTDIGNEGLHLIHGKEAFIANTTDEFVACLKLAFSGGFDLKKMNRKALRKVLERTSPKLAWESMSASLGLILRKKGVLRV